MSQPQRLCHPELVRPSFLLFHGEKETCDPALLFLCHHGPGWVIVATGGEQASLTAQDKGERAGSIRCHLLSLATQT